MILRPHWADDAIGIQWWEFHLAHPEVYGMLLRFCDEWTEAQPGKRCGMKMLWERLRWEHAVGNLGDADFKLNNNYTSLYARYIMEWSERYADLFETRERRSEKADDKPDPVRFTAYVGCPDAPDCQHKAWCRASGDCRLDPGGPSPAEMDEDAAIMDSLDRSSDLSMRECADAYMDQVQPWE